MTRPAEEPQASTRATALSPEDLGQRLLHRRQALGLTQAEAAARSGLSRSFVSTVEAGKSTIAYERLARLARTYGTSASDLLLQRKGAVASPETARLAGGETVSTGIPGIELTYLASGCWNILPYRIRMAPATSFGPLSHVGEEFISCEEGALTLILDGRRQQLSAGDSVVIPSFLTHTYVNGTESAVRVLGVAEHHGEHPPHPR